MIGRDLEEMLLQNHKEYENEKENLNYAKEGIKEIISYGGGGKDTVSNGRRGSYRPGRSIHVIERKIPRDFIEAGFVDFRGTEVKDMQTLVDLMQVYRNPRFETFRFIYMNDQRICAIEGVTSRLPAVSAIFAEPRKGYYPFLEKMERLGADSYYLLHNHPSGNVNPSGEDLAITMNFAVHVKGFAGHIILDHTICSVIGTDMEIQTCQISKEFQKNLFHNTSGSRFLDRELKAPAQIAGVMQDIPENKTTSILFLANSNLLINEVQEISNKLILHDQNFSNYLRNEMIQSGSARAFLCTEDETVYEKTKHLVEHKYLVDSLYFDYVGYTSARKYIRQKPDIVFAGIRDDQIQGYSVNEKGPEQPYFSDFQQSESEKDRAFFAAEEKIRE